MNLSWRCSSLQLQSYVSDLVFSGRKVALTFRNPQKNIHIFWSPQFKHMKHPVADMLKLLSRNLSFSTFHLHCTSPSPPTMTWEVQISIAKFSISQIQKLLYATCRIDVPAVVLCSSPLWLFTQSNDLLLLLSAKAILVAIW